MRFFCAYGTIFKIHFFCTSYIYSVSKTKEKPKTNQETSKELPTIKKCFLLRLRSLLVECSAISHRVLPALSLFIVQRSPR